MLKIIIWGYTYPRVEFRYIIIGEVEYDFASPILGEEGVYSHYLPCVSLSMPHGVEFCLTIKEVEDFLKIKNPDFRGLE